MRRAARLTHPGQGHPGVLEANLGFLTRVAVRRPEVRDALLELSPGNVESDDWVLFLEATGIADELRTGKRDAASWVRSYLAQYHSRQRSEYPRRLCGLIRGLPGLRGAPITDRGDAPAGTRTPRRPPGGRGAGLDHEDRASGPPGTRPVAGATRTR